jgi:hypothetical protein
MCGRKLEQKNFSTASDNRRFLIDPIRAAVLFWEIRAPRGAGS